MCVYVCMCVCVCVYVYIYTRTKITLEETWGTFSWKDTLNFEIYY